MGSRLAADGRIESPATSTVGRENFCRGLVGTAMQVNANLNTFEPRQHWPEQIGDLLRCCPSDRIGERDGLQVHIREYADAFDHFFSAPYVAVRIAERH